MNLPVLKYFAKKYISPKYNISIAYLLAVINILFPEIGDVKVNANFVNEANVKNNVKNQINLINDFKTNFKLILFDLMFCIK
jgi:hypothetical protein